MALLFAVATLDEAIELRMHGIKAKILILGVIPIEDINKAIQHRVAITVPSKSWLSSAIKAINDDNEKRLWLHIKLDTGMGRLGIKNQAEYHQTIHLIEQHEHLVLKVSIHILHVQMNQEILHNSNINVLKHG